jgi:hypothetical protein
MTFRLDVFQAGILLGSIDIDWTDAQTPDYFINLAQAQYPDLSRIEVHCDL